MSRLVLGCALVVSVVLAACGGGGGAKTQTVEPTATTRRLPAGTPVTTAGIPTPDVTQQVHGTEAPGSPTPTQVFNYCNTEVPEAAATPGPVQTLPVGHACIADAGDDVKNADGGPAVAPLPGADIAAVRIDSNGSVLLVTFYGNQPIPVKVSAGTQISWNVEILVNDLPIYRLTILLEPGNWDVDAIDLETGEAKRLRLASLYGKRLETPFPAEVLPKLTGPFTYRAWTESTGADGVVVTDWAPDAAGVQRDDPDAAAPFPK